MIFGEGYDTSLWLMLYSDNKNRNMILDFIKSIPEELFTKIYSATDSFSRYKEANVHHRECKGLNGYIETSNRVLYWFQIDPYSHGMTLGYSVFDGATWDEVFEIFLYPFNESNMKEYECIVLGDIKCDMANLIWNSRKCNKVKYELSKGILGWNIVRISDKRKNIKSINPSNIPSVISVCDIKNQKNIKRLARRKNK